MEIGTVFGLPAHPLLVHAAVVFVPLAALGAIAIAVSRRLRDRFGWLVVAAAAVALAAVQLAVWSGGPLEDSLTKTALIEQHEELAQPAAALDKEGFARAEHRYLRTADLRYDGQAFEVRVTAPDGPVDESFRRTVVAAFHDAHEQLYGYCYRNEPRHQVEWVNLRVSGVGPIARPVLRERPAGDADPGRARTGRRPVFFDDWVDAAVFWRPRLAPGDLLSGPAVIEEFGSTVPLHPGFATRVDRFGNLIVTRAEETP